MKKLLVTGISGFLGWYISKLEQENWQIIGTYHEHKVESTLGVNLQVDLTNHDALAKVLKYIQPDAVLHLAAASNPNFCEEHPQISQAINVEPALQLADYAAFKKIPMIFTSSDLVFDGKKGNYSEEDLPSPINRYGLHKAVAESKVMAAYPEAVVARLPLMYGMTGQKNNFLEHWLNKWKARTPTPAFKDEFRSPLSGTEAAKGLLYLLEKQVSGIWHLAGNERISRFDFGLKIAEVFQIAPDLIKESYQSEVDMPAARPADVSLNTEKIISLGFEASGITESLQALLMAQ